MQFILGRYEARFKKIARRNLGRSNEAAADIGRVHSHLLRNKPEKKWEICNNYHGERANFTGLVLSCIEDDLRKY